MPHWVGRYRIRETGGIERERGGRGPSGTAYESKSIMFDLDGTHITQGDSWLRALQSKIISNIDITDRQANMNLTTLTVPAHSFQCKESIRETWLGTNKLESPTHQMLELEPNNGSSLGYLDNRRGRGYIR